MGKRFAYWVILHDFLCVFLKSTFFKKNSFRNTIRVSNSSDPDQARHFVGPDLDPNCLQRLSADDTKGKELTPPNHMAYTLNHPLNMHEQPSKL